MNSQLSTIDPRDHAEEVAIFRAQVLGPLLARNLTRGEVAEGLRALASQKFRPPGSLVERSFALSTLEKWLYAHRRYGLEGLVPAPRSDRGAAQKLTDAQRDLLCEIREQYPRASAELILRTLEADGRLESGSISPGTLRRLFLERGLDRKARAHRGKGGIRRRWEAAGVDDLWHSDVCHGPALVGRYGPDHRSGRRRRLASG